MVAIFLFFTLNLIVAILLLNFQDFLCKVLNSLWRFVVKALHKVVELGGGDGNMVDFSPPATRKHLRTYPAETKQTQHRVRGACIDKFPKQPQ
jgi:hypothetical protein